MQVRIIENSMLAKIAAWKLRSNTMAITLGRKIYLHNTTKVAFLRDPCWVCHELTHVMQFKTHGFFKFPIMYLFESIRKGYRQNKWEIEARNAEYNHHLLAQFDFV